MYRFTDGNIHDVDFFGNKTNKITIKEENFEKEKALSLYHFTELPYPEDLEMIMFRYYTPDDQLIEQENVPVVYDGSGVEKIENQYLLTNKDSGIIGTEEGWTSETQTPTIQNRYVWKKEITYLSNKTTLESKPTILSMYVQGERGSKYLGAFNSNAFNEPVGVTETIVGMDFYLSKTSSTIYQKVGSEWVERKYTGYESLYKQAIGDCMELAKNSGEASFASIAFITNLFAENITITKGGLIKSTKYNGTIFADNTIANNGTQGWAIDWDGHADFVNMNATGGRFNNINATGTINAQKFAIISDLPIYLDERKAFIQELNDVFKIGSTNFMQSIYKGFASIVEGDIDLRVKVYGQFSFIKNINCTVEIFILPAKGGHKTLKKETYSYNGGSRNPVLIDYAEDIDVHVGDLVLLYIYMNGTTDNTSDCVRIQFAAYSDEKISGALKALTYYKEYTM